MTTDLSPSGIQRLLEICGMSTATDAFDEIIREALPDALREIGRLTLARATAADQSQTVAEYQDRAIRHMTSRIAALEAAIQWALGEGDSNFGDNKPPNPGPFWWRDELKRRAVLSGGVGE